MPTRLDIYIATENSAISRTKAVDLIKSGVVSVDGKVQRKPSFLVEENAIVEFEQDAHYVSRGARKLLAALTDASYQINVQNALCLDIGASTGGFTQVLLNAGARTVVALDVGHNQLSDLLLDETRIKLFEGVNVRKLRGGDMEDEQIVSRLDQVLQSENAKTGALKFDVIVSDVSFISLAYVLPVLTQYLQLGGKAVVLIKPQFEVGREVLAMGRGGVITDQSVFAGVIDKIVTQARSLGLKVVGEIIESPIRGGSGNKEFLCVLTTT
jgi:23S rRNA (cytidine1920-2'-O)/16S rRNA (cytidine1409-2'-O)-methyltransferase